MKSKESEVMKKSVSVALVIVSILMTLPMRSVLAEDVAPLSLIANMDKMDLTEMINAKYADGERGQSFDLSDDWSVSFTYQSHSDGSVQPMSGAKTRDEYLVGWCYKDHEWNMPNILANTSGESRTAYPGHTIEADEVFMCPGFGQNPRLVFTARRELRKQMLLRVYGRDLENGGLDNTIEVFINGQSLGSFDVVNESQGERFWTLPTSTLTVGSTIEVLVTTKNNPNTADSNEIGLHVELYREIGGLGTTDLTALVNEKYAGGERGRSFDLSDDWTVEFSWRNPSGGEVQPLTLAEKVKDTYFVGWGYDRGRYGAPFIWANISGETKNCYDGQVAGNEVVMVPESSLNLIPRIIFTSRRTLSGSYLLRVNGHDLENGGVASYFSVWVGGKQLAKLNVSDRTINAYGNVGLWNLSNLPIGTKIEVEVGASNVAYVETSIGVMLGKVPSSGVLVIVR